MFSMFFPMRKCTLYDVGTILTDYHESLFLCRQARQTPLARRAISSQVLLVFLFSFNQLNSSSIFVIFDKRTTPPVFLQSLQNSVFSIRWYKQVFTIPIERVVGDQVVWKLAYKRTNGQVHSRPYRPNTNYSI